LKIGIRREDKNKWERRVPLTPTDAGYLFAKGVDLVIQPSDIRVFPDSDYSSAGLPVSENAINADFLIAVKEIPIDMIQQAGKYLCFAHVIKAQPYNMPTLKRFIDSGCTLLDYEKVVDTDNRRLIFFSIHAGYAGMIESLRALGLRLKSQGTETPLADVKPAYEYKDLNDAEQQITAIGHQLLENPPAEPIVIGISGYGNVSQGAQKVLSWLPVTVVAPEDVAKAGELADKPLVKVVFGEKDMVAPAGDYDFELQDYFDNPDRYNGKFSEHLPYLDMLINTIFWTEDYPRLVTKKWAASAFADGKKSRLQVIGDISIDIEGSIEMSMKATYPDNPCFVYNPDDESISDGVEGRGICLMTVDNLPCELPRESSEHFSSILRDMVAEISEADWTADFENLDLPHHLKSAVILHKGKLVPDFAHLAESLPE
jgi:alpha-aminoadipic semialdehyde synthase